MRVKSDALDALAAAVERHVGVHRRPQAVAVHRQDHRLEPVVTAHQEDRHRARPAVDLRHVGRRRHGLAELRVARAASDVEAQRVATLDVITTREVDDPRLDPLELRLDALSRLVEAGDFEDVALALQQRIAVLHRPEQHDRGRHEHGADHAHQRGDGDHAARAVLRLRHGGGPSCARWP